MNSRLGKFVPFLLVAVGLAPASQAAWGLYKLEKPGYILNDATDWTFSGKPKYEWGADVNLTVTPAGENDWENFYKGEETKKTYALSSVRYHVRAWGLSETISATQKWLGAIPDSAVTPTTAELTYAVIAAGLTKSPSQEWLDLIPTLEMNSYALAYDTNASDAAWVGQPAEATYLWTNKVVVAATNVVTRPGYAQTGWNVAADGSGKTVTPGSSVEGGSALGVTNHNQKVTLYAQWKANQYNVTLEAPDADPASEHATATTVTYDQTPAAITQLPTRALWKFAGYYTQKNGKGEQAFDEEGVATGKWTHTDVTTLYAYWTRYKCTVTFKKDGPGSINLGGSQEYDSGQVISARATPDSYAVFLRWSDGETQETHSDITVISNATYTAYFSNITYTITFTYINKDFEPAVVSQHYERNARIYPPTDYYTIAGKMFEWDPAVPEFALADSSHKSKYVAETYQVTFDGNGADSGSMNPMPFEFESCKKLSKNAYTRTGYTFLGWNTSSQATTILYQDEDPLEKSLANPITLYAIWSPNSYTVKFDKGAEAATGTMDDQAFVYDQAQALTANGFTLHNQTFFGWATSAVDVAAQRWTYADGAVVSNLTTEANDTVTLTAVWSNYHYVRFDKNGATNETEMALQTFSGAETNALLPNVYGKVGYTFAGWATNPVGAASCRTDYTNCQAVSFPFAQPNETNDLYAVWATNRYTIVFDPGNAPTDTNHYFLGTMEPLTNCAYDAVVTIKCGYTNYCSQGLLGWSRTKGATTPDFPATEKMWERTASTKIMGRGADTVVSNLTAEANATQTLYAVWEDEGDLSKAVGLANAVLFFDDKNSSGKADWKVAHDEQNHADCVGLEIDFKKTGGAETVSGTWLLKMSVVGPGRLGHVWKFSESGMVSAGPLTLLVDGAEKGNLESGVAWNVTNEVVLGEGGHEIEWKYSGDLYQSSWGYGGDVIRLDDIVWTPDVVVKPGEEMPTYETKEAAEAAAKATTVTPPNDEVAQACAEVGVDYNAMFDVKAIPVETANGGDWTLAFQLKESVSNEVQTAIDEAETNLCSVITNNPISVSVTMKPGLYYGLAATNEVEWLQLAQPKVWLLGGRDDGPLSAPRPSETNAFYEVRMAITPKL